MEIAGFVALALVGAFLGLVLFGLFSYAVVMTIVRVIEWIAGY
ncbi:hypothetical protein J4T94_gp089 [Mycobacterium phage Krypton555]|uniref:Uncharacterized protein n=1 Tax=Mycobacterium phage Krypton555 TaxID=2015885 RepID=A0A222ZRW1_9CAUD|nr:hypothetical protein J4T94_gp089 [Mycobacterium phage Krypton555]ASR87129.1 hypothetical protein KRYPTON555_93 [Mycobacterium phage Krypton555]